MYIDYLAVKFYLIMTYTIPESHVFASLISLDIMMEYLNYLLDGLRPLPLRFLILLSQKNACNFSNFLFFSSYQIHLVFCLAYHYNKEDLSGQPKPSGKVQKFPDDRTPEVRPLPHQALGKVFLADFRNRRKEYLFPAVLNHWEKACFSRRFTKTPRMFLENR